MSRFILMPVAMALLLSSMPARAGTVRDIHTQYEDGIYRLAVDVIIDGRFDAVYGLVTDYDRLKELSDIFVDTALISPPGVEPKRRRLVARACVFLFCDEATMVEDVEEIERKTILTRVVPELSDFKYGKSRWEVSAVDADHSRIRFSYEIQPDFWVPPLIGPYFIKRKLLAAARQTITRIEVLARDG